MEEGIRVLLVEDSPGDARLVGVLLEEEPGGPFHLEVAGTIADALRRMQRSGVDIVLLDRQLPDSLAWEGLRAIRQNAPRVPVVVLTGSVDPRISFEAAENGAQDCHVKGVFPSGVLGRTIVSSIVRHQTEERLAQGRDLDSRLKEALGKIPEGLAVFEGPSITYLNPSFTEVTGFTLDELRRPPPWLRRVSEPPPTGAPASASGLGPARFDHGDFFLDRKDGSTVDIEYVAKSFGRGPGSRTLLWLRVVAAAGGPPPPAESSPIPVGVPPKEVPRAVRSGRPHGPTPAPPGSSLDAATWVRLRELAGTSPTFLPLLVANFLAEGRALLRQLDTSLRSLDIPSVRRAAHTLAASSAQVGAFQLQLLCQRLETPDEGSADADQASALVQEVAREFAHVVTEIDKLRIEP
ncbi:MAG TPA: response regulator [Thermoplasmata archaeon]|nr:response regulator [Thermoplasmata archaeon]